MNSTTAIVAVIIATVVLFGLWTWLNHIASLPPDDHSTNAFLNRTHKYDNWSK